MQHKHVLDHPCY